MQAKTTRKKTSKASSKPMVVARKDLESVARLLQALATAKTMSPCSFWFIDHEVKIVLSADRYSNVTANLSPAYQPVERGRKGGGPVSQKVGEKIRYHNLTGHQVTLTFWNNANKTDSSIASKELDKITLTLADDAKDTVTLTDTRENCGHQDIWIGIQVAGIAPGSGAGGGPGMGIDDPPKQ